MGVVGCCRKPEEELEKNLERNQLYTSIKNINNYKNTDLIILTEQPTTIKYINNENNEKNNTGNIHFNNNNENNDEILIKDEKAKKIQNKYRSHLLKNKFNTEIKPILSKSTNSFIQKVYQQCSQGGEISPNDDFDPDGWKKYYPNEERFFLYQKGNVFENQIRIKNPYDPENLEIYEGETNINNLKHGSGKLTTPHYILQGTWRKDEFTGWGRKSMRNGDIIEGKFVNGDLNGKGIFKGADNSIYVGDFVNSMRNGKGELTTDKLHYIGEFKDDKINGKGVIDFLKEGHRYEGNFENNEINGKGIYKWKNGDVYEGELKNGKMDGYGKLTYADGKIFEGEYINGIRQGRGKLVYPNNKIYEGIFEDGWANGEGFYTVDGHTSKVLFSNGEFVKLIA